MKRSRFYLRWLRRRLRDAENCFGRIVECPSTITWMSDHHHLNVRRKPTRLSAPLRVSIFVTVVTRVPSTVISYTRLLHWPAERTKSTRDLSQKLNTVKPLLTDTSQNWTLISFPVKLSVQNIICFCNALNSGHSSKSWHYKPVGTKVVINYVPSPGALCECINDLNKYIY